MPIKITQLPELQTVSSNTANNLLVMVDLEEEDDYLKTKKITLENFLKDLREYGQAPNVFYVSPYGNNNFDGKSWDRAFLTIEKALEVVTELEMLTLIELGPGTYLTEGHLDMPDDTIIRAAHRSVIIRPKPGFEERNVFRMGSGCFIEGPVFEDWRLDDMDNPSEGFAVSFRPGAVIRRVPYAHKIAVRTTPSWTFVAPPLDRDPDEGEANPYVGRGAGVALADGSVCSPYSIFPNIMTWGATPVSHNGIGYCAKNGGLINAVNAVCLWSHRHFYALSGGQIILSSCSTQFGDYTMVAKGVRQIIDPYKLGTISITEAQGVEADQLIDEFTEALIDSLWNSLVSEGYTANWNSEDELFTRRDAATFLQSLRWVLLTKNEQPILDFTKSLFTTESDPDDPTPWDANSKPVFTSDKQEAFEYSFEYLRDEINALPGISGNAQTIVINSVAAINNTLQNPKRILEPSTITAIGHTWSGVMAGVALTKIPPAKNSAKIQDSILELERGLVIASGQDDQGSAIFVGGLEINADTGELSGPPFISAVNRIATKTVISRSF
jgi:hypothetical protein